MEPVKKRILFDSDAITKRVREIGGQIALDYPGGNLLLVGILKGSFVFLADLVRSLPYPCQIDFARISSYGTAQESSGNLNIIMDVGIPVTGRDVILVDDIVDSGLTLSDFRRRIEDRDPRSLKIAAMVNKTGRREKQVEVDYCGFQIEEGFLVGYGLDWDERFRNYPAIYVLE